MPASGNGRQRVARVSIVIITRNEGAELRTTVENAIQTVPASDREIIVVDDGSEDGSTGFLDGCSEVQLVRTNGLGVARAS